MTIEKNNRYTEATEQTLFCALLFCWHSVYTIRTAHFCVSSPFLHYVNTTIKTWNNKEGLVDRLKSLNTTTISCRPSLCALHHNIPTRASHLSCCTRTQGKNRKGEALCTSAQMCGSNTKTNDFPFRCWKNTHGNSPQKQQRPRGHTGPYLYAWLHPWACCKGHRSASAKTAQCIPLLALFPSKRQRCQKQFDCSVGYWLKSQFF